LSSNRVVRVCDAALAEVGTTVSFTIPRPCYLARDASQSHTAAGEARQCFLCHDGIVAANYRQICTPTLIHKDYLSMKRRCE